MDDQAGAAYRELLKQCLTRYFVIGETTRSGRHGPGLGAILAWLAGDGLTLASVGPGLTRRRYRVLQRALGRFGLRVFVVPDSGRSFGTQLGAKMSRRKRLARIRREFGVDWPAHAETMVGLRRLDNVEHCVQEVIRDRVPGDLLEAGVWRGGTAIFMRAALASLGEADRRVWVADSFQGLPKPDARAFPADAGLDLTGFSELAVGVHEVRANFSKYGMLDDRVEFLPGWFKDTLASAPIEQLAILRLDGDLYESTIDALDALYPKLAVGGYCIVDDYGALAACRRAVHHYRERHGVTEPLHAIDWCGAYWRRER